MTVPFRPLAAFAALLCAGAISGPPAARATIEQPAGAPRATFTLSDHQIELAAADLPAGNYEWRLRSRGLVEVETSADVNEVGIIYLPPPSEQQPPAPNAENIFFFNDLSTTDGWELLIEFPAELHGRWKLNGRFSPLGGELARTLTIPAAALEAGENLLHVEAAAVPKPVMCFRRMVSIRSGQAAATVTVTHPNWVGEAELVRRADSGNTTVIATQSIAGPELRGEVRTVPARWWEDREFLDDAALAVGRSLLRSQVKRSGSLFEGGFNLVYDPEHYAYRMPHWLWAWGPAIHYLLEASKLPAVQSAGVAEPFRAAALAAGRRSLAFEMTQPDHPARGVSTVRWEPSHATPLGYAEYLSTADSLFLAGWGWMSLYAETHEPVYLERMQRLVAAAERLMNEYPVIPQDWIVERNRWTPHTLDESVFGTIGFRRLYDATRSPEIAAAGKRFLDSHREHMGRESGLLMRAWMRDENKEIWDPDIKGHAWVMEGYLDAYRLSGERRYLELAGQLADKVMACQSPDGSWTYLFKLAEPGDPIDDKGTAIWAYLFYDLYRISKNSAHLAAGRRALGWCLRAQYRGADEHLDGAIFHPNSMAYVRRRPMTILYSTTFFGLALLEERALSAQP